MKIKYRVKFSKKGRIKFIGHLDLLKLIQKTINRSEVPIAYSNGFNPHQIISFAAPLPLGYETEGDYLDIELTEKRDETILVDSINKNLPKGLKFEKVILNEVTKNSASILIASEYKVNNINSKITQDVIASFMSQDEIIVEKKTKKGCKEVDIKNLIYNIDIHNDSIYMIIATGSIENLKPELLINTIYNFAGIEFDVYLNGYTRLEMFYKVDNELRPLGDI